MAVQEKEQKRKRKRKTIIKSKRKREVQGHYKARINGDKEQAKYVTQADIYTGESEEQAQYQAQTVQER